MDLLKKYIVTWVNMVIYMRLRSFPKKQKKKGRKICIWYFRVIRKTT